MLILYPANKNEAHDLENEGLVQIQMVHKKNCHNVEEQATCTVHI